MRKKAKKKKQVKKCLESCITYQIIKIKEFRKKMEGENANKNYQKKYTE